MRNIYHKINTLKETKKDTKTNKGLRGIAIFLLLLNPHLGYSGDLGSNHYEEEQWFDALEEQEKTYSDKVEHAAQIAWDGYKFVWKHTQEPIGVAVLGGLTVASNLYFGYDDVITILASAITIDRTAEFRTLRTNNPWLNSAQVIALCVVGYGAAVVEITAVSEGLLPEPTSYPIILFGAGLTKLGHVFTNDESLEGPSYLSRLRNWAHPNLSKATSWSLDDLTARRTGGLRAPKKITADQGTFDDRDDANNEEAENARRQEATNETYTPKWLRHYKSNKHKETHPYEVQHIGTDYDGDKPNAPGFLQSLAFGRSAIPQRISPQDLRALVAPTGEDFREVDAIIRDIQLGSRKELLAWRSKGASDGLSTPLLSPQEMSEI